LASSTSNNSSNSSTAAPAAGVAAISTPPSSPLASTALLAKDTERRLSSSGNDDEEADDVITTMDGNAATETAAASAAIAISEADDAPLDLDTTVFSETTEEDPEAAAVLGFFLALNTRIFRGLSQALAAGGVLTADDVTAMGLHPKRDAAFVRALLAAHCPDVQVRKSALFCA
jgi:hypothetical protein